MKSVIKKISPKHQSKIKGGISPMMPIQIIELYLRLAQYMNKFTNNTDNFDKIQHGLTVDQNGHDCGFYIH